MEQYYYKVYGYTISSTIQLAELHPIERPEQVMIEIVRGKLEKKLAHSNKKYDYDYGQVQFIFNEANEAEEVLISYEDQLLTKVIKGSQIIVDELKPLDAGLLGSLIVYGTLPAILYQHHIPIHGSAISTEYGAVIFTGLSGNGKSTIAARFVKDGAALLTDDVCIIDFNEAGQPVLLPGTGHLRLFDDSLAQLSVNTQALDNAVKFNINGGKYDVAVGISQKEIPLIGIYEMCYYEGDEIHIQELTGLEKLNGLMRNVYMVESLEVYNIMQKRFEFCNKLVNKLFVRKVRRSKAAFSVEDLYQNMCANLAQSSTK